MRKKAAFILTSLLVLALAVPLWGLLRGSSPCAADSHASRALDYLRGRQQADGGIAEAGEQSSGQLTSWAIAAIASAGDDPSSWRTGASLLDFLSAASGSWSETTDLERGCLAVSCAGGDPRTFAGRNLVGEIQARMGADGHIGDLVNDHCWGIIALAQADETIPDSCRSWLVAQQNTNGGFGYAPGAVSDPDDTGAALQALIAAGESPESSTVQRALEYLRFCQASDGGFCWKSSLSNTASTAWAVQGICAAGQDPGSAEWARGGRTPLDFLRGMQQPDGHVKYSERNDLRPAWMTIEAIPALLGRAYPLTGEPETDGSTEEASSSEGEQAAATTTSDGSEDYDYYDDSGYYEDESYYEDYELYPFAEATTSGGEAGSGDPTSSPAGRTSSGSKSESGSGQGGVSTGVIIGDSEHSSQEKGDSGEGSSGSGLRILLIIGGFYLAILAVSPLAVKTLRQRPESDYYPGGIPYPPSEYPLDWYR